MKTCRRIALLLVLLVCFASFALAEGEIGIAVDTVSAAVDDRAVVSLSLANAVGMDSLQLNIHYDSSALRLIEEPVFGDILDDALAVTNTDNLGMVVFAFASRDGLTADGTAITLTFEVLTDVGSAVTVTDVQATTVDGNFEQHKAFVAVTDGGVAIGEGSVPAPVVTPWIAETPTPEPTATPAPTPEATAVPTATPVPVEAQRERNLLPVLLPVLGGVLLIALGVLLFVLKKREEDDPV